MCNIREKTQRVNFIVVSPITIRLCLNTCDFFYDIEFCVQIIMIKKMYCVLCFEQVPE